MPVFGSAAGAEGGFQAHLLGRLLLPGFAAVRLPALDALADRRLGRGIPHFLPTFRILVKFGGWHLYGGSGGWHLWRLVGEGIRLPQVWVRLGAMSRRVLR